MSLRKERTKGLGVGRMGSPASPGRVRGRSGHAPVNPGAALSQALCWFSGSSPRGTEEGTKSLKRRAQGPVVSGGRPGSDSAWPSPPFTSQGSRHDAGAGGHHSPVPGLLVNGKRRGQKKGDRSRREDLFVCKIRSQINVLEAVSLAFFLFPSVLFYPVAPCSGLRWMRK